MTNTVKPFLARNARVLVFPISIVILFVGLVAANLSGSSIGELGVSWGGFEPLYPNGVVAGEPQRIRTDEWVVTTPLSVQAAEMGFPTKPWVGITESDVAALVNVGPSWNWSELVRPQDWGYFVFGASYGLAWHWWFSFLVCLLGAYFLLWHLTRRVSLAIAGAFMIGFSPYTAWWSAPSTALVVGFGAIAALAFAKAVDASRNSTRALWGLLSGYALAAVALLVYPPWSVSVAWVVAAICLGQLIDRWKGIKAAAAVVVPAIVTVGVIVGAWYLSNSTAITTMMNTIYPGQRKTEAGTSSLLWFLTAPSTFGVLFRPNIFGGTTNLSEAAVSWLPLLSLVVGAGIAGWFLLRHSVRRSTKAVEGSDALSELSQSDASASSKLPTATDARFGSWTVIATGLALILLLSWAVLEIPEFVGKLTLLDKVQPGRTPAAIGFAAAVLLILCASVISRSKLPRWVFAVVIGAGVLTVPITMWATVHGLPNGHRFDEFLVAVSAAILAIAVTWLLLGRKLWIGATLLAIYVFASWVFVNPLQYGLGPLRDDPIVAAVKDYGKTHPDARFLSVGESRDLANGVFDALVRGAGVEAVGGMTYYPDWKTMETLAPGKNAMWNNTVNYVWESDPAASPIEFEVIVATLVKAKVNLCAPQMNAIGLNAVASVGKVQLPCLREAAHFSRGPDTIYLYERSPQ